MELIYNLFSEQFVRPAQYFFRKEAVSSVFLIGATIIALVWANSGWHGSYDHLWHVFFTLKLGDFVISHDLIHWLDDGLMTLFFFTVGLEIKREILVGELSSPRKALFPVVAAFGGMLVPGLIYVFFNHGTSSSNGWGIPMATDIAFALGAIAIFGKKLPAGLRVFLAAFAIADDLGAVLVIALFYTGTIMVYNLVVCGILLIILGIANFLWVRNTLFYAILGIAVWFSILESGIHPTVAGILVSMFIPAQGKYQTDKFIENVKKRLEQFQCEEQACGFSILLNKDHLDAVQGIEIACHNVETPLQRMEHALHPWVAFLILPLFALGNAGLTFNEIDELCKIFNSGRFRDICIDRHHLPDDVLQKPQLKQWHESNASNMTTSPIPNNRSPRICSILPPKSMRFQNVKGKRIFADCLLTILRRMAGRKSVIFSG